MIAGLDPAEMISQLRAAHAQNETKMGVDVVSGQAGDMQKLGIFESFKVGPQDPSQLRLPSSLQAAICNARKHTSTVP